MPKPPKRTQVARSSINFDGKSLYLGRWPSRRAADIARDRAILHFGIDAALRYPRAARHLGPASPAQLLQEARSREKKRTTSRFLGVSWQTREKLWQVSIQVRGKRHSIAGLHDEEQAAILRDRLMLHLLGKSAVLNFPNRKLRPASYEQLQDELRAIRSAGRYRGVTPQMVALRQTWSAHIGIRQKTHFLGRYETERDAAIAYDRAARHYFGEDAKLNLPIQSRRLDPADAAALRAEAHAELKKKKHSRFHGVSRKAKVWTAGIVHQYRVYRLGSFASEEEAAVAYDKAALRLHGKNAKLNFHPQTGEELCGQRPRPVERVTLARRGR